MALLTQAEYAKRKGVTPQYVNKLVAQGKIVLVGRKVNPKQADAAIKAGHRPGARSFRKQQPAGSRSASRDGRNGTAKAVPLQSKSKTKTPTLRKKRAKDGAPQRVKSQPARPLMSLTLKSDAQLSATKSLTAARAESEKYKALTAKLDYERLCGQLLPKAQVLEAERRKNMNIRGRFRKLASSLAEVVARTTSPAEVQKILLEEIDLVLDQLSRDVLAGPAGSADGTAEVGGEMMPPATEQGMGASV